MKKIIYRDKATGKISFDGNYEDYLRAFHSEELIAEKINTYNREGKILRAEIVELDDIAEFYAKRAEKHLNIPADVGERLREIASEITDLRAKACALCARGGARSSASSCAIGWINSVASAFLGRVLRSDMNAL